MPALEWTILIRKMWCKGMITLRNKDNPKQAEDLQIIYRNSHRELMKLRGIIKYLRNNDQWILSRIFINKHAQSTRQDA